MKKLIYFLLVFILWPNIYAQKSDCTITNLKCEHLINPLGIDVHNPRLSWTVTDSRQGAIQKSYRVVVDSDSILVTEGKGTVWNTGEIDSDKMLITYSGKELKPFSRYYWSVIIHDKDNQPVKSSTGSFETGMMDVHNWKGSWISDRHSKEHKPAPYFRKVFKTGKPVKTARAYIAAGGLYELSINGEKIGNHRLDPMFTRYDRRILYVTYDVTENIQRGENAVGVILGNGWYNHQAQGVWNFNNAPWRNRPAFCLDIRITYLDGSEETISSGLDWKTSDGSIRMNNIYTAENQDANKEKTGWNTVNYDDSHWGEVMYRSTPSQNIVSQQLHPIRNVDEVLPKSMQKINDSLYVFDLGRNIAGVSQLKISGTAGTVIHLKHTERLKGGRPDLYSISNFHRPLDEHDLFQTDVFTLAGKGEESFMPKFNYKGFRYVEVSANKPINLNENSLVCHFMHSDVPPVGHLETSNPLINKIWAATNTSYLSNLFGYPTDCPQREKNGWTGDGHLGIESGLYNYDAITIYEKWMADHRDEQQPNGVLPDIIPTGGWGYGTENGLDWTSTIALIPWNIYLFYGDSRLLEECYENIKAYVNYVDGISAGLLTSWGRGDWVPVKTKSSLELTSSIYFYVDAKILADAAKLFGKEDDYAHYSQLAENIKNAINRKYLDYETGIYATGSQTELSTPLLWGIVPDNMKAKVATNLAANVEKQGWHVDVGVLGCKAILNALSENGYADTAYKLAAQDTYPSWGWWIVKGFSTLLEDWNPDATHEYSDNHMMFGEVSAWFFKALGGIKPDPQKPGFRHILLSPHFVEGLNYSNVSYQSPSGLIVSNWNRKGKNKIIYNVEIPANCSATFRMPDNIKNKREIYLPAGKHSFELNLKTN